MGTYLLDILTDKQRVVFLYKIKGYSYAEIAKEMGISPLAAKHYNQQARRSLQELRVYHDPAYGNGEPASLPLTRGELSFLLDTLIAYSHELIKEAGGRRSDIDWQSSLTYSAQMLEDLFERGYAEYFGKPADFKLFDANLAPIAALSEPGR